MATVNLQPRGQPRGVRGSGEAEGQGAAGLLGASLPLSEVKGAPPSLPACPQTLGKRVWMPPPSVQNPSNHLAQTLTSGRCRAPD